jgi:hypothetical protein
LQVLHDPQPTPIVEFNADRLTDMRLGRHGVDGESRRRRHFACGNLRGVALRKGEPARGQQDRTSSGDANSDFD